MARIFGNYNENGLTFKQFVASASFGGPMPSVGSTLYRSFRKAWENGEDPADWAAQRKR